MDKKLKAGAVFQPSRMHRDTAFGGEPPEFLWCMHCERAYRYGEFRPVGSLQMCPYTDCDGDTVVDAWSWKRIRQGNPSYPERPREGEVYTMYGE